MDGEVVSKAEFIRNQRSVVPMDQQKALEKAAQERGGQKFDTGYYYWQPVGGRNVRSAPAQDSQGARVCYTPLGHASRRPRRSRRGGAGAEGGRGATATALPGLATAPRPRTLCRDGYSLRLPDGSALSAMPRSSIDNSHA